jgi:hypothetical protein
MKFTSLLRRNVYDPPVGKIAMEYTDRKSFGADK